MSRKSDNTCTDKRKNLSLQCFRITGNLRKTRERKSNGTAQFMPERGNILKDS